MTFAQQEPSAKAPCTSTTVSIAIVLFPSYNCPKLADLSKVPRDTCSLLHEGAVGGFEVMSYTTRSMPRTRRRLEGTLDIGVREIAAHGHARNPLLLPLDGARRLGGDVVDHTIDAAHLVDDAPRRVAEKVVGEIVVVGGHAVGRGDGAKRAYIVVGARIAHDADGAHREQHGESLPDRVVEAGLPDLVEIDGVGAPQDGELLLGHFAGHADGEPGPREGMAVDEDRRQPKLAAERPHLVLEQLAQRLDQLEPHTLRQAAHIMVRLDGRRRSAREGHALDHVGIERALREEIDLAELVGFVLVHLNEQAADGLALLLRVGDATKPGEEARASINGDQRNVVVAAKEIDHLTRLVLAEQPMIDEDAGELIADRFVDEQRRDGRVDPAREPADHAALPDLTPDARDFGGAELRHRPIAGAACYCMHEIGDEFGTVRRMHDLRMELYAIKLAGVVSDGRERRAV